MKKFDRCSVALTCAGVISISTLLSGCTPAQQSSLTPSQATPSATALAAPDQPKTNQSSPPHTRAPEPVPVRPFEEALMTAAHSLFSMVELPTPGEKHLMVIDPLIDGVSGVQSIATRSMESRITELVRTKYPQFSQQPFSAANVRKSPMVLVGTFTPVNAQGETTGVREAYRICLVLADLKSGTVISKGTARAQTHGVNHTPTPYFQDSPAWMREGTTDGYINKCQASKPGDKISRPSSMAY
jgi:hypothetical protein